MTKTLTEQWREGTLESGHYYIRSGLSTSVEIRYLGNGFFEGNIEVLAPVPSYKMFQFLIGEQKFTDEMLENIINIRTEELLKLNAEYIKRVEKLEKRNEIATKALKKIIKDYEINGIGYLCVTRAKEALKEMEGVK